MADKAGGILARMGTPADTDMSTDLLNIKSAVDGLGGGITLFDSENADRNLTTLVTVLTDTPDASNPTLCQGIVYLGDGAKDLDGTGGLFDIVVTVGGQTIQPSPQRVNFDTAARSAMRIPIFPVPANTEVIIKVLSSNGADSDVDVTAYLIGLL